MSGFISGYFQEGAKYLNLNYWSPSVVQWLEVILKGRPNFLSTTVPQENSRGHQIP